ncbi:iron dicitrate transport regulator FecR [Leptospira gomenensis]|uniref:Iron dicitrate transport regulator FecR n=1 Tax=Leptospira gomenensis TaxID=2484974 RepID=A0A5F1YJ97_9LEPT|nr:FecR domain-containing protein [Leptospira gomenensis]TGK38446.1 iron dicitrate transport regulator FecR [Leptospira gomenensis]TGK42561.1 iron dicitrate transport regulator FecR [Leptospira gomenensis]TGK42806.1 iron dicitrate transport regulator FecR [Leptospira gomenensis]TGK55809.1 iron dicitrate transport regulator FecR [Leptospira gomenensis]
MKLLSATAILLSLAVLSFTCKQNQTEKKNGVLTFVNGDVIVQRGDQKIKASVSQEVQNGDVLITGAKSAAAIVFGENASVIEIQSESQFRFQEDGKGKNFFQEKGSSWILTNKLNKDETLTLRTPTTTAGVRGTKFFTALREGMTFTCFCQGQVELENTVDHSKKVNDSDYLAVTKGDKTIYVTSADLHKENLKYLHDHSEIENSPVGGQNRMSPDDFQKLFKIVKNKFEEK